MEADRGLSPQDSCSRRFRASGRAWKSNSSLDFLQVSALQTHSSHLTLLKQNHGVPSGRSQKTRSLAYPQAGHSPPSPRFLPPALPYAPSIITGLCPWTHQGLSHFHAFVLAFYSGETPLPPLSLLDKILPNSSSLNSNITWKGLYLPIWKCPSLAPLRSSLAESVRFAAVGMVSLLNEYMFAEQLNDFCCPLHSECYRQGLAHFPRTFHPVVAILYSWILHLSAKMVYFV